MHSAYAGIHTLVHYARKVNILLFKHVLLILIDVVMVAIEEKYHFICV